LNDQLSTGIDVWSWGCLLFYLVTGNDLFYVDHLDGDRFDETTNDQHLIRITETIQPLPNHLFNKWSRRALYYGPDGERLNNDTGTSDIDALSVGSLDTEEGENEMDQQGRPYESDSDSKSQAPLAHFFQFDTLEERFRVAKPADIDEEEEKEILSLMRMALQLDAKMRPSATQLLQHKWFY
jgi:non-specific serine/threonine protein kinase